MGSNTRLAPLSVCVATGSRADFGLLAPVMTEIANSPSLALQVLAVGLNPSVSSEYAPREACDLGAMPDEWVPVIVADSPHGVAEAIAATVTGASHALERLCPDLVMFLGDRFEILGVALAATTLRIPLAHVAGGDLTLGAYDEGFRHALTKLSHLHFTTNEEATHRLRQLGEEDWRIHTVGSPGIDVIRSMVPVRRTSLEDFMGFRFRERNIVVTLHPTTLEAGRAAEQADTLVAALDELSEDVGVIVTASNADSEGAAIDKILRSFCDRAPGRSIYIPTLGHTMYLSLLSEVDAVVGNSSSGLYEAPSFGVPTVNIGSRQDGRLRAASVIDCAFDKKEIICAISHAMYADRLSVTNPYGDGFASPRIVTELESLPDRERLLRKQFVQHQLEER